MQTLARIERCESKLRAISLIENFEEIKNTLDPQLNAVITACNSVKSSVKLKRVLEMVLAFGNYMNSSRRGGAYGFKISALDRVRKLCQKKKEKKKKKKRRKKKKEN